MNLNFLRSPRIREAWEYRSDPESLRVLAAIFWRTVLFAALIAMLMTLWFGFQELSATSQAESVDTNPSAPPKPGFDNAALQSALTGLESKQVEYQTFLQSPPAAVVDPSK